MMPLHLHHVDEAPQASPTVTIPAAALDALMAAARRSVEDWLDLAEECRADHEMDLAAQYETMADRTQDALDRIAGGE